MMELRPTRIILISLYCFLLGLYFLSLTANLIFSSNGFSDAMMWLPVLAAVTMACVFTITGIGILYYNQLCWKVLFFFLVIAMTNAVALIMVSLILLWLDAPLFYKYSQGIHVAAVTWYCSLAFFLSGIIILYYHTRREIVSYFGDMGAIISPF